MNVVIWIADFMQDGNEPANTVHVGSGLSNDINSP